ncbi:MFS transporter, partial [Micromonospora saelicesensis]|uniref:MFS transporter n=1 Tax=Micromonospora saelicesensis TaxID=285676 RepID=UPI001C655CB1
MIILDGTVVAVALPAIQRDLGFSAAGLAWVVNAYLVAFGGLLLLAGRLGDLLGRRRVFLAGVALFTVASLACAVATGPALLVGARFGQGIGGALAMAVSLGMIVRLYPEAAERARAIAVFSFTGAAGASVGTVAGGVLTQAAGWRTIFALAAVLAVLLAIVLYRAIPPLAPRTRLPYAQLIASVGAVVVRERAVRWAMVVGATGFAAFSRFWTALTFLLSGRPFRYPVAVIGLFGLSGLS